MIITILGAVNYSLRIYQEYNSAEINEETTRSNSNDTTSPLIGNGINTSAGFVIVETARFGNFIKNLLLYVLMMENHDREVENGMAVAVVDATNDLKAEIVFGSGSSKPRLLNSMSLKTKKGSEVKESENNDIEKGMILQHATSKSRIPVTTSKSKSVNAKKQASLQTLHDKPDSSESKYFKGYKLFKRFMGLQSVKPTRSNLSMEEIFVRNYSFGENPSEKEDDMPNFGIPISFFSNINPYMDQTVGESMRQMIDLRNKLEESEKHVKDMVVKYIRDKNLEKDLVNIICGHSKLLLESERQALNLASNTWMQQSEIYKDQQRTLQDTLNSIVQQNRELLSENDTLIRKNERLSAKVVQLHEMPATAHRSTTLTSVRALEDSGKNNEKLRVKLSLAVNQIDDLEVNLKKMQKKSCYLQQQLGASNLLMQNNKSQFDRQKADYELEHAKLLQEYQSNKLIIKESIEAGDVLLEDLDGLKPQMKLIMKSINWDKFKRRGKSLTDLIHLSRSCINELFRELSAKQNEITLQQQENQNISEDIEKSNIIISNLQTEKTKLEQTIQDQKDAMVNLKLFEEKYAQLQSTLSNSELTISTRNGELANKECSLRASEEEIKKLNAILGERDKTVGQLQAEVERLSEEKTSFQVQIKGMAQVLEATGTGEIAKELANTQEKLTTMQEKFYAVSAENRMLLKQIEASSAERDTLIAYQKSYYKHLQVQQHEMETTEVTQTSIKEQLEAERQTVIALQTERVRHLEEKTILTAIYERLKSELSKVDQLEDVVSTMNKKASKLAVIAEFNKQLGEKLQSQVAERDHAIAQLQNNVKQLNELQLQSTKEKMALCEELSQIFNVKEVLNSKLTAEQQRNANLGEYKKEIENAASAQLKELHTRFDVERAAMKNLMLDVSAMKAERDMMMMANKELVEKFSLVEKHTSFATCEIENLQREVAQKNSKIITYEKELTLQTKNANSMRTKLEGKLKVYKQHNSTSKEMIQTLTQENNQLKDTVHYLQADIRKVRADLDASRECEANFKKVTTDNAEKEMAESNVDRGDLEELINENVMLKKLISQLTDSFKELANEYERATDETAKFEAIVQEKFATSKYTASNSDAETPITSNSVQLIRRDNEILVLQEKIRKMEKDCAEFAEHLESLRKQRDTAVRDCESLDEKLGQMTLNYEESQLDVANFLKEIELLKQYCKEMEKLKTENNDQKKSLEKLTSEYGIKLTTMQSNVDGLTTQVKELTANCSSEVNEKIKVEKARKALSLKLLQAVQLLIAEKLARKEADNNVKKLEIEMKNVESNNAELGELLERAQEQIEFYKKEILDLNLTKADILESLHRIENIRITDDKAVLELQLPENSSQYKYDEAEARVNFMKHQLEKSNEDIIGLQEKISTMEGQYAVLEFQKFEALLRFHDAQGKIQTEEQMNVELQQATQNTLAVIERMYEEKSITSLVYSNLLSAVQSTTTSLP